MRKFRRIVLSAIVTLLLTALCVSAVACGGKQPPEQLPVKDWQEYLNNVAVSIDMQYAGVDRDAPVTAEFRIQGKDLNTAETYDIMLMFDLSATGGKGVFRLARGEKILWDIYNEDDDLYVRHLDETTGKYVLNLFEHAPLMQAMYALLQYSSGEVDYSTPGKLFVALGKAFFVDGTANAEHTEFTFRLDLRKGLQSAFSVQTFDGLPEVVRKLLYSLTGSEDYASMVQAIPQIRADVVMTTSGGKLTNIRTERMTIEREDHTYELQINAFRMHLANGTNEQITQYRPNAIGYETSRLTDLTASGTLSLRMQDQTVMTYEYEVRAKFDILEWIVAGGDLRAMPSDNAFHLSIRHRCDTSCGAYCQDKLGQAKGSVLDIAFAPDSFGTYDIYVSIGLHALLSKGNLAAQYGDTWTDILTRGLPEYKLMVLDPATLTFSAPSDDSGSTSIESSVWSKLLYALEYADGQTRLRLDSLMQALGMDETQATSWLELLFPQGQIADNATIESTYVRYQYIPYDVMQHAVHLYGADVSGTKQYTALFQSKAPAIRYEYNDYQDVQTQETDLQVTRIYRDDYVGGLLYDGIVPMCEEELPYLIGATVKVQETDIYGQVRQAERRIVQYDGWDPDQTGWQRITVYTVSNTVNVIDDFLLGKLGGSDMNHLLWQSTQIWVRTTPLQDVQFDRADKTAYQQGEKLLSNDNPEQAQVHLEYADGSKKAKYVTADNTDDLLCVGYDNARYVHAGNNVRLEYKAFGTQYSREIAITPARSQSMTTTAPEVSLEWNERGYRSEILLGRVQWLTADGKTSVMRLPMEYVWVNDMPITEENPYCYLTGDGEVSEKYAVFYRTGKYTLSYRFGDMQTEVQLYVTPKQETPQTSAYGWTEMQTPANVFVGYTYRFQADIVNLYHGQATEPVEIGMRVLRGYTNTSGGLSYVQIPDDGTYYTAQNWTIGGNTVENPCMYALPATIYGSLPVVSQLQFNMTGYFKIEFYMGLKTVSKEIYVAAPTQTAHYDLQWEQSQYTATAGVEQVYFATLHQTDVQIPDIGLTQAYLSLYVQDETGKTISASDYSYRIEIDGVQANRVTLPPMMEGDEQIAVFLRFAHAGKYKVTLRITDSACGGYETEMTLQIQG